MIPAEEEVLQAGGFPNRRRFPAIGNLRRPSLDERTPRGSPKISPNREPGILIVPPWLAIRAIVAGEVFGSALDHAANKIKCSFAERKETIRIFAPRKAKL
jgi:hypothetical protein